MSALYTLLALACAYLSSRAPWEGAEGLLGLALLVIALGLFVIAWAPRKQI